MPLFDYVCSSCNHEDELLETYSDDAVKTCPKCCKITFKRKLINKTSFSLNGKGWYKDSYS